MIRTAFCLVAALLVLNCSANAAETNSVPSPNNYPSMVDADGSLQFKFGDERLVLPRGLQPSLLRTTSGALVVQGQVPEKPQPTSRMVYPSAMETRISRDNGVTWQVIPRKLHENGVNLEGGAVQLRDGTILALDTYVMPGANAGEGIGQLYFSTNDWHTLEGPVDVSFDLPKANFYGSADDGGHPHNAMRLHRRILELPNGDLLTTIYGWLEGDNTPSQYQPKMKKTRVMLVRSSDKGRHWKFVSTVAADSTVGTEGYDEAVLARVSKGDSAGQLICQMRTGRELREATSDNEGVTWTAAVPRVFAGLDVYRTELWIDMFRGMKALGGRILDEKNPEDLRGAVVDPDLIELRSGLLVAAFGVRITQKDCWRNPHHPWNGNYLAVSSDHGKTWKNVIRMTSGVLTTHYM
ncbi:MAG: sialidase family protein, partial [Limisphaerales bacterium]